MRAEGRIYVMREDNDIEPLEAREYDSEDLLQSLLEEHPDLLGGEQINPENPRKWLLVTREMAVPDDSGASRWSVDHLFLDQDGVPNLVEVKRSSDTRIRREVVGQMLDYAANAAVHWPAQQIRSTFEERCVEKSESPSSTLREFLEFDGDEDDSDVDRFWDQVDRNLREKRLRLLFVADSIPPELRRIVEFLNEVMTPTEALAVEIRKFSGEGITALVPRVTGQTEARRRTKQASRTSPGRVSIEEAAFMDAVRSHEDRDGTVFTAVGEIVAWSKTANLDIRFEDASRGPQCVIRLPGSVALLQMENSARATSLVMTGLHKREPFNQEEVRESIREELERIPGFSLGKAGMTGWPAINLSEVVAGNRLKEFVHVLDWMVEQWRTSQHPDT